MDFIVVRDRRQPRQFSIANVVIDQWFPIIGMPGYTIYSLYVRMASIDDERCWPGYTLICTHLGMAKATVSDYNKLLCWARLVHVEAGDRQNTNNYYILDVPEVDAQALHRIRQCAEQELSEDSRFRRTILFRLDRWEPIQVLWGRPQRAVDVIRPGQMSLPGCDAQPGGSLAEHPSSLAEHPSSLAEHPSSLAEHPVRQENCNNPKQQSKPTGQTDNPKQQQVPLDEWASVVELLATYGVEEPMRSELGQTNYDLARAWCLYASTQELRNPAGFVVASLRARRAPDPEFYILAGVRREVWEWLEKHRATRGYVGRWPAGLPVAEDVADLWYEHFGGQK